MEGTPGGAGGRSLLSAADEVGVVVPELVGVPEKKAIIPWSEIHFWNFYFMFMLINSFLR